MTRNSRLYLHLLCAVCFVAATAYAQQPLLQIVSPSDGSLAPEGQIVTITVAADPSVNNIYIVTQSPLPNIQTTSDPTQFTLSLPTNIPPGRYQIAAIGSTSTDYVESTPIQIDVERQDDPRYLTTNPTFLTFLSPGNKLPIDVLGFFPTGGPLSVTKSTRTTYLSNDPQIATVSADGFVTAGKPSHHNQLHEMLPRPYLEGSYANPPGEVRG